MRVIIADDHALFRDGLEAWLAALGVDVTGAARHADELVDLVAADPPDLVVTDIAMPPRFEDEGLRAAETLAERHPDIGVLILSAHHDPLWAMRVLRCRPERVGYLLKHNVSHHDLLGDALARIAGGGLVIDPEVVADLVTHRSLVAPLDSLTTRELRVLAAAAEGRSNRGISALLGISERTVENHITHIFQKLDLPEGNQRVLAILELQKTQNPRRGS